MNITFYTTTDKPETLDKTLNIIGTAHVLKPTTQINTLNPVVVCNYSDTLVNANYAYIDTFARYYYITTGIDTAGRLIVSGTCDVLMSWKDSIKTCACNIVRANLGKPSYVIDKKYPVDTSRFNVDAKDFPQTSLTYNGGVVTPQYIMITR